jgi:glutathione S-transferase
MRLLCAPPSPFASKVRMAARHLNIQLEEVYADTSNPPPGFLANNPLGKLPVLLRDGAPSIYDSVSIMHFLDRHSGGKLYPAAGEERNKAEVLEALCDGITDCLIVVIYERRFRPEEKVHNEWIDRQWTKVERGLDYLEASLPGFDDGLTGGHFSLAALLGYLALRFSGKWEANHSGLANWGDKFTEHFRDYPTMKPLAS